MRRGHVLLAPLLLYGCSDYSSASEQDLDWAKAPGGGVVAFYQPTAGSSFAVRCMSNGSQEKCLIAQQIDGTSTTFQVVDRSLVKAGSIWANHDGYQCMHILGLATSQQILKDGRTLMSASAPALGGKSLPPRNETLQYMRLNVPNARAQYFDCDRVADIFSKGSLATAATTSITADLLSQSPAE